MSRLFSTNYIITFKHLFKNISISHFSRNKIYIICFTKLNKT